jgi:hypothetical protein
MDQCNTIRIAFNMEGVEYGTIRTSWPLGFPKNGCLATVETRTIVERHWSCPGQGRWLDPPGCLLSRWDHSAPLAPARTLSEREEIFRGIAADQSMRQMATRIGRPPSMVSREIARHGVRSRYWAAVADETAWAQARRPKPCRLALHPTLRRTIAHKLSLDWSSERISGWLLQAFPDDKQMRVSHETIYRSLFSRPAGSLKRN